MAGDTSENLVALYWDFENIHASVLDEFYGYSRYDETWRISQEAILNIRAIMDYAATVGVVTINRAYCNWHNFSRYRDELNLNGLDLIQHFPKGMKNGADIRLALDVIEDLHRFPHITHTIIVGSDSDYISLAQKVKQLGKRVVGIGVQQSSNPFWIQCCNEFKFYKTLVDKTEPLRGPPPADSETVNAGADRANLDDAKELLFKVLRQLITQRGENHVPRSAVKPLMLRLDPSFDEANFGFGSFSAFIDAFPDEVRNLNNSSGGSLSLLTEDFPAPEVRPAEEPATGNYALILKQGNVRQLPCPWWRETVVLVEEIFQEEEGECLPTFEALKEKLAERLRARGMDDNAAAINKLKINLFALHMFQLSREENLIRLDRRGAAGATSLLEKVDRAIVGRLIKFAAPPIDPEEVGMVLYNESSESASDQARKLIEEVSGPGQQEGSAG